MTDPGSTYRLIDLPGQGPEDVVVDGNGFVLTGLNDGRILRVDADTGRVEVLVSTDGRPLGLEVLPDGRILICDSPHRTASLRSRNVRAQDAGSGGPRGDAAILQQRRR